MGKIEVFGIDAGIQRCIGIRVKVHADFTGISAGKKANAILNVCIKWPVLNNACVLLCDLHVGVEFFCAC